MKLMLGSEIIFKNTTTNSGLKNPMIRFSLSQKLKSLTTELTPQYFPEIGSHRSDGNHPVENI